MKALLRVDGLVTEQHAGQLQVRGVKVRKDLPIGIPIFIKLNWSHRILMAFGLLCGIFGAAISIINIIKAFKPAEPLSEGV